MARFLLKPLGIVFLSLENEKTLRNVFHLSRLIKKLSAANNVNVYYLTKHKF